MIVDTFLEIYKAEVKQMMYFCFFPAGKEASEAFHLFCGSVKQRSSRPIICFVGAKRQAWDIHSANADCCSYGMTPRLAAGEASDLWQFFDYGSHLAVVAS